MGWSALHQWGSADMTDNSSTPKGWYPAPHANGELRYWDGNRWTEWTPEAADAAARSLSAWPSNTSAATAVLPTETRTDLADLPAKRPGLRWWVWVLIGVGAVIVLMIIIGAINADRGDTEEPGAGAVPTQAADTEPDKTEPVETEPEDTRVKTPYVVGKTVAEARVAFGAVGLPVKVVDGTGEDWLVTSQTITVPAEPGTEVMIVAEAPKPVLTLAQQNAVEQGRSYLDYSSFSRSGLIGQLEYEGYTKEESTFAVDFIAPDWNAECAEGAASYLDYSSFSRDGLYAQLEYEGFTPEQIAFGLAAVGY